MLDEGTLRVTANHSYHSSLSPDGTERLAYARNQGGTAERNERFVPEWTERFCVSSDVQDCWVCKPTRPRSDQRGS